MKKIMNRTFLIICFLIIAFVNTKSVQARDWGSITNGNIYLFYCSHQDLGWEDSYDHCKARRNQNMIEPVVGWAKESTNYKYCIEYTRSVKDFYEYTQSTPGKTSLWNDFITLVKAGQIEVGGTYNCGYESLFSGEGLVRQTYLGRKWLKSLGCDTKVAWNVDPPIRALQTAQIYKKAGIKYLIDSRYKKGYFKWKSPNAHEGDDDYSLIVYSQGDYGYSWSGFVLRNEPGDPYHSDPAAPWNGYNGLLYPYSFNGKVIPDTNYPDTNSINYVIDYMCNYWNNNDIYQWPNNISNDCPWAWQAWDNYYGNFGESSNQLTGIFSMYYSTDMGMPRCYIACTNEHYNSTLLTDWANNKKENDPNLHLVTAGEALDKVMAAAESQGVSFKEWQGELPNIWIYIHGPAHYQLISKMRSAERNLSAAEMFTSFNCILNRNFSSYPENKFTEAWEKAIFPDQIIFFVQCFVGKNGVWY